MRSKRIKLRHEQNGCVVCVYLRVCTCLIVYVYMSLCGMSMCSNYISTVCVGVCD